MWACQARSTWSTAAGWAGPAGESGAAAAARRARLLPASTRRSENATNPLAPHQATETRPATDGIVVNPPMRESMPDAPLRVAVAAAVAVATAETKNGRRWARTMSPPGTASSRLSESSPPKFAPATSAGAARNVATVVAAWASSSGMTAAVSSGAATSP